MPDATVSPYIIPFFISHAGCPHQCVFCNQRTISGTSTFVTPEQVSLEIRTVLERPRDAKRKVQVAFYGGSFTGIDLSRQRQLLGAVQPFLQSGEVDGIRLSTRPDCIDPERIELLLEHGVSLVELGVQSLAGDVLDASGRGHDEADVANAFSLLHQSGLQVGGQLMVGLPADTPKKSVESCRKILGYRPDCLRIYPTLVMGQTPLNDLYGAGDFTPWSLGKTVAVVARMHELCSGAKVPVIRMGLQSGESLAENMVAGPYHPAFGELVLSRLFFKQVRRAIFTARAGEQKTIELTISSRDHSLFMGMKKENMQRLRRGGWLSGVKLCLAPGQPRFQVVAKPV